MLPRNEHWFDPPLLTPAGDTLFFRADDGVHGSELWKTDGTEEGTVLVADTAITDPVPAKPSLAVKIAELAVKRGDKEAAIGLYQRAVQARHGYT